jgi:ABC-type transport system involved in multi-copper enzyme maturation permease subunit
MNWLLWKEARHNRVVIVFGLLLLAMPYLLAAYGVFWNTRHGLNARWPEAFAIASLWSLIASQLTIGCIAGNAIAGERVDRSAEFLASLPVSRRKILASKLLFAAAAATAIWVTDGTVLLVLRGIDLGAVRNVVAISTTDVFAALGGVAVSGVAIFGVAWSISSILTSATIPICGGVVTPLVVWLGIGVVTYGILGRDPIRGPSLGLWYAGICLTLGIASFIAGTWYYLRRVEP